MAWDPFFWGIKLDANICQQYKSGGTKPTKIGYMNHFRRVHSSSRFWGDQSWSLKSVVILRDFRLHKVPVVPVGVIFHDPGLKTREFQIRSSQTGSFFVFVSMFFFHMVGIWGIESDSRHSFYQTKKRTFNFHIFITQKQTPWVWTYLPTFRIGISQMAMKKKCP